MIEIIKKSNRNIVEISQIHYELLAPNIEKAINKYMPKQQGKYILNRLETIIKGTPKEIIKANKNYLTFCRKNKLNKSKGIKQSFSYLNFNQRKSYNPYHLAELLKVNVCPYCNRQYTYTINTKFKNITRPEFDHFFHQEKYPLLALSFYNLIPSCYICNSRLKGRRDFTLTKNLHPYLDGFYNASVFNYLPNNVGAAIGLNEDLDISFIHDKSSINYKQIHENCKVFKLEEIYKEHKDIVREIIRKRYISGGNYLTILQASFPELKFDLSEVYKLAFGNYDNPNEFEKRPLGKLTFDIINNINFNELYPK